MKPNATLWERFEGWFCQPIEKLKECPEGNGAFLALSAALFLCERYYRTLTNTHEGQQDSQPFLDVAAHDLAVDPEMFNIFWRVYRHGIQHQGMPRQWVADGCTYRWNMSAAFSAKPTFHSVSPTIQEIRIDPWKFADLIKRKYQDHPELLRNATVHAFGAVVQIAERP
jgi:hypothetical protein